jgi:hypothetical protein
MRSLARELLPPILARALASLKKKIACARPSSSDFHPSNSNCKETSAPSASTAPVDGESERVRNQSIIPKFTKDGVMDWLCSIDPGMLKESNIDLFAYCIDRLPNSTGAVIEIGSWAGLSLNHLILLLKNGARKSGFFG